MTTSSSVLLVHGRDFKPEHDAYLDISVAALRSGIERDYPDHVSAFDDMQKELAWYGDLNAEVLRFAGKHYDESLDVGDRRNALAALREVTARKKFGVGQYDRLPGKSAVPEFFVSLVAPVCGVTGLTMPIVKSLARDMALYLDYKSDFGMRVRERLKKKLCALWDRGDRVVLIAHGSGSVVAYDVLWQFSHDPDLKDVYSTHKIDLWLTLGSPLGDSSIRKRLLGAREKSIEKFPVNVVSWHNVSAEDDYTCHDNTLADDFRKMMQQRVVSAVLDHKIFNHAVRYGRSNPHSSVGYYIHPRVSKILVDWLTSAEHPPTPTYTL